ncbi:MAG: PHP domain-containing protein, partial [Lachnospiraceae bacterium]|nr:PHP domain-containing protein [Lachnospiraceae bacterium]
MQKPFFEVFPVLDLGDSLHSLLEFVQVSRVTLNRERTFMRVYLESEKLIYKKDILELEQAIRDQLFYDVPMTVKIIERFHLSRQYTPRNLMSVYEDSILLELKNYNALLYSLMRESEKEFTADDTLCLRVPDTVVADGKEEELLSILEKIFCERCGMNFHVSAQRVEPKTNKKREMQELELEQEVAAIARNYAAVKEDESRAKTEPEQESSRRPAKKQPEEKKQAAGPGEAKETPKKKSFYQSGDRFGGRRSDNPDVVYGRDFEGEVITIESITGEIGGVIVRGQVLSVDLRELRNEKTLFIFNITDFTDSIGIKLFTTNEQAAELAESIKTGAFLMLTGVTTIDRFDSQLTIGNIRGIKKIADFREKRVDTCAQKRVELHCHTKMSDMDGVSDVKDIIKRAISWGHPAIAITDHGAVQAFPDANHAIPGDGSFKVIYGMEAYLVDDLKEIATNTKGQTIEERFVVFDLETTGFSPEQNRIIEIGAVKVEEGRITDRFSTFVNPEVPIPFRIEELTSINDNMVLDAPVIEKILPEFMQFCEGCIMVAHNASFDMSFIDANCRRQGLLCDKTVVDTVAMARVLLPNLNRFKLDTVAKALGVSLENHHRAVDDAACTADIFVKFLEMLRKQGVQTLEELNDLGKASENQIKKLPTYHAIILAKNDVGRVNLYRLVSWSHLQYYNRRPRVPKSMLQKYREGLILGSACEAGELYQALLRGSPDQEISRLVNFYDYLEIQPLGNNMFMTREDREDRKTVDDLIDLNKRIVELGERFQKPVVATCDVHFLDPQDEVYRRIIMASKGFKDADDQAPLYLR